MKLVKHLKLYPLSHGEGLLTFGLTRLVFAWHGWYRSVCIFWFYIFCLQLNLLIDYDTISVLFSNHLMFLLVQLMYEAIQISNFGPMGGAGGNGLPALYLLIHPYGEDPTCTARVFIPSVGLCKGKTGDNHPFYPYSRCSVRPEC